MLMAGSKLEIVNLQQRISALQCRGPAQQVLHPAAVRVAGHKPGGDAQPGLLVARLAAGQSRLHLHQTVSISDEELSAAPHLLQQSLALLFQFLALFLEMVAPVVPGLGCALLVDGPAKYKMQQRTFRALCSEFCQLSL